jgi:hypothetical protein
MLESCDNRTAQSDHRRFTHSLFLRWDTCLLVLSPVDSTSLRSPVPAALAQAGQALTGSPVPAALAQAGQATWCEVEGNLIMSDACFDFTLQDTVQHEQFWQAVCQYRVFRYRFSAREKVKELGFERSAQDVRILLSLGSHTRNVEPCPTVLCTSIVPPTISSSRFTICSPSPIPP